MKKIVYLFLLTVGILGCTNNIDELPIDFEITSGIFIDSRDNHVYQWITIENQTWMAENLAYLPTVSHNATDTINLPSYYVYEYNGTDVNEAKATLNYATYGVLYDWTATLTACPEGWHLPSDEEWKQLEIALGMTPNQADESNSSFFRGTNQGVQMKNKTGWQNNGNGTNTSGFSGLPGGYRFGNGDFCNIEKMCYWWTSTEGLDTYAWGRGLSYSSSGICRSNNFKENGFSIRCIKD